MILKKNGKIKDWGDRSQHLKFIRKRDFEELVRLSGLNLEETVGSPNKGSHLARFMVAEFYSLNPDGFEKDCKFHRISKCSP